MNSKLILWSITVGLGGFLFGMDTAVISGAAARTVVRRFGEHIALTCKLDHRIRSDGGQQLIHTQPRHVHAVVDFAERAYRRPLTEGEKAELRGLGSLILACATQTAVPAGSSLAVDREAFAQLATERIQSHPLITLVHEEVTALPDGPTRETNSPGEMSRETPLRTVNSPSPTGNRLMTFRTCMIGSCRPLSLAIRSQFSKICAENHKFTFILIRLGSGIRERP